MAQHDVCSIAGSDLKEEVGNLGADDYRITAALDPLFNGIWSARNHVSRSLSALNKVECDPISR
jgi:hypothetical protein